MVERGKSFLFLVNILTRFRNTQAYLKFTYRNASYNNLVNQI